MFDSSAKIPVVNPTQMCAVPVPIVRSKITNPSVLVPVVSLATHLSHAESLPEKICVLPTLVDLEPLANLEMIDRAVTGLYVLVLLDTVVIPWSLVLEVNFSKVLGFGPY